MPDLTPYLVKVRRAFTFARVTPFTAVGSVGPEMGGLVVQVQAHNWIGATEETWGTLTYLDAGDLDFANHIRILRSKGFDGVISIDHPTHGGQDRWEDVAAREVTYLRDLIASEADRPPTTA